MFHRALFVDQGPRWSFARNFKRFEVQLSRSFDVLLLIRFFNWPDKVTSEVSDQLKIKIPTIFILEDTSLQQRVLFISLSNNMSFESSTMVPELIALLRMSPSPMMSLSPL
jgi:hypothetical protein